MLSFFKKNKKVSNKVENITLPKEDFTNIESIAEYFQSYTGITFDKQIGILQNKVTLFCRQRKIYSFVELLKILNENHVIKQEFIDYLTTNETYFYREFKQIEQLISLVNKEKSNVNILCAPSATGEEPYSIAIACLEAGIDANSFHIIGIDINQGAIDKAQSAIYGARSLKNLSENIIDKYFQKQNDKFVLKQSVKSLVTFRIENIFDSSFQKLGKFDFIFSRNMLIYFDKETKIKAKEILENMRKNKKYDVFFGHADLF